MYNNSMIKRIYIEITNQCNLNCTFCKQNSRTPHFMSFEQFEHVLNNIGDTSKYLYLHVQGEPLLHPKLKEFISLARSKNFNIQIATNGSLLKNHMDLVDYGIRKISFSLHSIDHQNIDKDMYLNNILTFCENTSKLDNRYCELRFNNVNDMGENSKYLLSKLKEKYDFTITSKNNSFKIMNNVFVSFSDLFEWPSMHFDIINDVGYCRGGLDMLAILSDGTISACCLDAEGDINLGNIYKDTIKDILNSKKYLSIINNFKNRKVIEELCKRCSYRSRFD